jgi:hypothetical protein
MFGIGLKNAKPWPVVAVGYEICSFGLTLVSGVALTYTTDSCTEVWHLELKCMMLLLVLTCLQIVGDALVGVTSPATSSAPSLSLP